MAEMLAGSMRLENESMKIPKLENLQVMSKSIMGVHIPKIIGGKREILEEYLLELPTSINEAIRSFQRVHKIVLDIAEKETALRKLLIEIEKTKRKSNAIENVFIPKLMSAVKFITFRLAEMERDTFIMLKTVKRKMGEERRPQRKLKNKKRNYISKKGGRYYMNNGDTIMIVKRRFCKWLPKEVLHDKESF